ncbi:hypothetical protein CY35_14G058200 [Sphagnum magellanicum]|nr:hypothetical protein CY35_14G058200 [Sphagnum magellanicum]
MSCIVEGFFGNAQSMQQQIINFLSIQPPPQVFVHILFPILKMLNFGTAILVNIYEQQDMWASSHALGCCK